MIRRRGVPEEESSEEDEEDVFSNLAKKQKSKNVPTKQEPSSAATPASKTTSNLAQPLVPSVTSSMKRHHGAMSNTRKAKMDALIHELETKKTSARSRGDNFIPEKKGSYVEPGDEHLTTNLFVGNLAPGLTETAIMNVFAQYGDLHSVKIMWPRTDEERARGRVSGFVCYRHRSDAEDAMEECSEADPFGVGRRLMIRWGKTVLGAVTPEEPPLARKRPRLAPKQAPGIQEEKRKEKASSRRDYRGARPLDGTSELDPQDVEEFNSLTRKRLCASRQAICEAMAFCFEHSGSYLQVGRLLKDLLLESQCSVETRIARLYLLSDILFNSQQPGVKNAFRYRDAIEKMAHDVFYSIGQHGSDSMSRMKRNKIQTCVRAVLAAWTNWGVFDPSFLDELETRFEGREIVKPVAIKEEPKEEEIQEEAKEEKETIILAAQGNWAEVDEEAEKAEELKRMKQAEEAKSATTNDPANDADKPSDQQFLEEDIDGEPLEDDDLDEEGLKRLRAFHEVTDDDNDGGCQDDEPQDDPQAVNAKDDSGIDGEPLDEGDLIGANVL